MYSIGLNKVISLVRGDTFEYAYDINIGTDLNPIYYQMQEGDFLYFAICEPNQPFENAVVKKRPYDYTKCYEYEYDDQWGEKETRYAVKITLTSDDTVNLSKGKYYYTIKLAKKTEEGYDVITTQPKTLFFLV